MKPTRTKLQNILFYLSAFFLPFTIMLIAFIALDIYPFGNAQVLVQDAWHQYYPFLLEFYRKVEQGESLLYDWHSGLGASYTPLMAYYLTSPLNIFVFLFPASLLREVFALFILIKIGFAGAFCSYALYRISNKKEYGIIIFSTLYALCSWTCCHYCHIMWLDTFAIFPLVVTGIRELIRHKKCRLYTISLAFAIFSNYYMGLLVCIFTAIYFFAQCIVCKNDLKELRTNLKNIIVSSVISILISAIVLLPVIMTMSMQSSIAENQSTAHWQTARGWIESLANTLAYREITIGTTLPNLYCGVICMLFLFAYYRLPGISRREKTVHTALLLFFYAGININVISYLLNGLHTPVGMPYRFSFMLSFLLIVSAYQVYTNIDILKKSDWKFMCAAGAGYCLIVTAGELWRNFKETSFTSDSALAAEDGTQLQVLLLKNVLIIAAYMVLTFPKIRKKLNRKEFTLLLAFIVEMELVPTVMAGTKSIGVTIRDNYPDKYSEVREILNNIEDAEEADNICRIEFTESDIQNPAAVYDYPGISVFSSTANSNVIKFFQDMGLYTSQNKYIYQNSTPVINMFLNLKYLIARDSEAINREYLTEIQEVDDVILYKNEAYLPIGFMADAEILNYSPDGDTPFENQNLFLKSASGTDEDVFEALDITHVEHEMLDVLRYGYGIYTYEYMPSENNSVPMNAEDADNGTFQYNYEMPKDGCAYVYMNLADADSASVEFRDTVNTYNIKRPNIFPAGTFQKGDLFSVTATVEPEALGDIQIYVSMLDEEVFERVYESLHDESLEVTEFTDKGLKGNISVKEDGVLYTSIPCERGWKVYVDGQETEITPIADTFIGVMLPYGDHVIEFRYAPVYIYPAILLSFAGITLLVIREKIGKSEKNEHCP